MNRSPYIPAKTQQELVSPAPVGQRHAQMLKIIPSLLGQGFFPDAVFAQLRGMYDSTVKDREITDIIAGATKMNFRPCTPRFSGHRIAKTSTSTRPIDPVVNIRKFLAEFDCTECDLWHVSPWRPLEDWRVDPIMFLAGMYHASDLVNIVTEHRDGRPIGYGQTMTRDEWMRHIRDHGTPQSKAGVWLRLNPVDGKGVADANITSFRFALLEIDHAPLDVQLSFFAKLPLPINAILFSGGKSAHAIVRINAKSAESYRAKVNELLALLKPFGIDQGNKNPSRLTRLVGAQREIGAQGDGQQRLLYLAPDRRDCKPIFEVHP